ncbi:uncharacterized protein LOC131634317 [Vicia villosa]|uniref:uncharacterized protein LOC131634317 n=1 Tax=Vicia villosa TaxID=3911 RepID=UPI00273B5327|nr:uncharacterized protein LOC131634317 [Vicia villosa]
MAKKFVFGMITGCLKSSTSKSKALFNFLPSDAKVSCLIDLDLGCWCNSLIQEVFVQEEARQVLAIPLSFRRPVDELIWNYEKSGNYSVKSAYHLLVHGKRSKGPGPSSVSYHKLGQKIWQARLHPRVRNFLWRLAKDILPTKENLQKKGITLDTSCSFCQAAPETAHHLFLQCEFARSVCFSSCFGLRLPLNSDLNDWIYGCLDDSDVIGDQLKCSLLWQLWKTKNLLLYQQKSVEPWIVAEETLVAVKEFNITNPCVKVKTPSFNSLETPSDHEVYTMNVDAGCFEDGSVAFGCLIKNQDGNVLLAACKREEVSVCPLIGETLAIRWSLQVAKELKVERILVQSDALSVVDCINAVSVRADIDHVIRDCQFLLSSFKFASVVFINRSFNSDAHSFVGLGNRFGSRTWLEMPSCCNSIFVCPAVAS